jgi:hypothetical protein
MDNSRLSYDDIENSKSLTKAQQRKSQKQQKKSIATAEVVNHPIEQLLSVHLVPNIVVQYNLRYQLQSHEVLKQMQGQVNEDEVDKIHEDLEQAQED